MTAAATGTKHVNTERLAQVILAPVISEKSTMVGDLHNQVVFRVVRDATKPEIKAAVERMFKVEVEGVRVLNVMGKQKRFAGRFNGRRPHWKKAYVRLKAGQEINFAAGETK
jgi:large subunit ribosomal protein L23